MAKKLKVDFRLATKFVTKLLDAGLTLEEIQEVANSRRNAKARAIVAHIRDMEHKKTRVFGDTQHKIKAAAQAAAESEPETIVVEPSHSTPASSTSSWDARRSMAGTFYSLEETADDFDFDLSAVDHCEWLKNIPFSEGTLLTYKTGMLFPVLPLSISNLIALFGKGESWLFPSAGRTWYEGEDFAIRQPTPEWCLLRKTLRGTCGLNFEAQLGKNGSFEYIPQAVVLAQAAILHVHRFGTGLFPKHIARSGSVDGIGTRISFGHTAAGLEFIRYDDRVERNELGLAKAIKHES